MVVDAGSVIMQSNAKSYLPLSQIKTAVPNLVLNADDLLRIREKVCQMYTNKKVVLAPCMCKLYISREQQIIDCEGKTTQDWFYFGTGVIAVIYNEHVNSLKLALLDEKSSRLLWCMRWADYVTFETPTSNFQVVNTKSDFSQHVGFLYENKDVADLILNTITLITSSVTQTDAESCTTQRNEPADNSKSTTKTSLFRSLSTQSKKLRASKSVDITDNNNHDKLTKRRASLRDSLLRRTLGKKPEATVSEQKIKLKERSSTVIGTTLSSFDSAQVQSEKRDERGYESSPETAETAARKKLTRLHRANSFRNAVNKTNLCALEHDEGEGKKGETTKTSDDVILRQNQSYKTSERKSNRESTHSTDSVIRSIFRKRRISRSQSLKIMSRKRDSQISQASQAEGSEEKQKGAIPNAKEQQRATKLIKPRSSTDSLLLRGEIMNSIIETGHVARYARERKQWAKRLEKENLQSTDLCVTEL